MSFDERVLNGMSVFSAIVRSGSFAGAGRALNMSQPGVSRALARLESRLGIRLLERTTRSLVLTDAGRGLYEQLIPLLSGLEEAAAIAIEGKASIRGRLRVNVHPFFAQIIVGPKLRDFLTAYPDLTLELLTQEKLGDMVGDGFDLAIRFGDLRPSTLVARRLLETRILTVAAPTYIKRFGKPETPNDLETGDHTRIDFRNPETSRPFQWEFQRGRRTVQVATTSRLVVNDVVTMHNVCLSGYGIAQVMELGVEKWLASGQLVELFPDWAEERFPLYALYPSRSHLPAKTRAFLKFIIALVERPERGRSS